MDLGLEAVQRHGGKMRAAQKAGGQHGDLPLAARLGFRLGRRVCWSVRRGRCAFRLEQGQVGELLVAHLGSLAQNLFAGGVGQNAGVVDSLRYCAARELQLVGDVLDGNSGCHRNPSFAYSIVQMHTLVKCANAKTSVCTFAHTGFCAIIQTHRNILSGGRNNVDFCHTAWYKKSVRILHLNYPQGN